MINLSHPVFYILMGILAVTLIDVLGSVSSRKIKYNYTWLTPFSLCVYTLTGFYVSRIANMNWSIIAACVVSIYDCTAGWKISLVLKANFGYRREDMETPALARIFIMICIGAISGYAGYYIAQKMY